MSKIIPTARLDQSGWGGLRTSTSTSQLISEYNIKMGEIIRLNLNFKVLKKIYLFLQTIIQQ